MSQPTVIVIPCYNEAQRLEPDAFRALLDEPDVSLLFVDDGSTDDTLAVLERMCGKMEGRARALALPQNCGKAEAVRQGMLKALEDGAEIVGFLDADLATAPSEMLRLWKRLDDPRLQVAIASRIRMLGTRIDRNPVRHYLGRVFATAASLCLGIGVYDTQCGAKCFRRGPALAAALKKPFLSRWAFDVELLGRLLAGTRSVRGIKEEAMIEMPLLAWRDKPGSKLRPTDFIKTGIALVRTWYAIRKYQQSP
jgi:glycosyltransferase involved in cell wall biosynthesis